MAVLNVFLFLTQEHVPENKVLMDLLISLTYFKIVAIMLLY